MSTLPPASDENAIRPCNWIGTAFCDAEAVGCAELLLLGAAGAHPTTAALTARKAAVTLANFKQ
jgi:hypothetical protein